MKKTVKIPTALHKIHGKQSNWFDIIATHLLALLTVAAIVFLINDLGLPSWKRWELIALHTLPIEWNSPLLLLLSLFLLKLPLSFAVRWYSLREINN